jgi:hypothetical protein
MSEDLPGELLATLPPIAAKPGEIGSGLDANLIEAQLLRLAGVSLDEETEKLRALLDALKRLPGSSST